MMKTNPFERKKPLRALKLIAALLLIASVTLSGCVDNEKDTDMEQTPTTDNRSQEEMPEEYIYGTATIEKIELQIMESFPVQVSVRAEGYLPDGCTEIDEVKTKKSENTFEVTITTRRPKDAVCTQAIEPFTQTIPLEVLGLKAGTYSVSVNGVSDSFELAADNSIITPDSKPTEKPAFTEADNGTEIRIEKGTVFTLKLPENPTTGYSWKLEQSEGLSLVRDEYIQDEAPQGMVGVGGVHVWEIKATAGESQQINAVYIRPWENETGEEKHFELKIKVL